jgi:ribonuclease T1
MINRKIGFPLILLVVFLMLCGCSSTSFENSLTQPQETRSSTINANGVYSTPEDVAEYIHTYNKLPDNFVTKKEAIALGWESDKGNLWEVSDQLSIGGDVFGNREGKLPRNQGRKWYECDVNYGGGYRGAERILFSSDGLIYYTKDHYETFTKLY